MKYRLKVYYRTPLMDKITDYMREIMEDWKRNDKRLQACQSYEFVTEEPLTDEKIAQLKALKKPWMDEVELEEIKGE
ncbi:hypothetical protein ES705_45365 [subsurface metagenome]